MDIGVAAAALHQGGCDEDVAEAREGGDAAASGVSCSQVGRAASGAAAVATRQCGSQDRREEKANMERHAKAEHCGTLRAGDVDEVR